MYKTTSLKKISYLQTNKFPVLFIYGDRGGKIKFNTCNLSWRRAIGTTIYIWCLAQSTAKTESIKNCRLWNPKFLFPLSMTVLFIFHGVFWVFSKLHKKESLFFSRYLLTYTCSSNFVFKSLNLLNPNDRWILWTQRNRAWLYRST